jgi:hypothetical protein
MAADAGKKTDPALSAPRHHFIPTFYAQGRAVRSCTVLNGPLSR